MRTSVVIVTYNSAAVLKDSLPALAAELHDGDELIVVDNAFGDDSAGVARELVPEATVIRSETNDGFAAACNRGAAAANGELLVFLNPDAVAQPGFRAAIARPLAEQTGWGAWMGLVTMEQGRAVNTSGGVLHFTGLGWAGQAGQPVAAAPAEPTEVAFASGACFAIPRARYLALGGFPERFFMYCEDVDLSLRVRLAGERVGVVPAAVVDHSYEFDKGDYKWRLLERNRAATVVRTYPGALLALVAPALLATELAIFAAALGGGWGRQKLLAWADLLRALPQLVRERRAIQAQRAVTPAEFAAALCAELSSPYLGRAVRGGPVALALRGYWRVVLLALSAQRRG